MYEALALGLGGQDGHGGAGQFKPLMKGEENDLFALIKKLDNCDSIV